jgi:signal transduction histidine kinase
MEQLPFVILAQFFVSVSLCIIFFMAWRAFGRPRHALTWSVLFFISALQWALNLAWGYGWITNFPLYWVPANITGAAVSFLAVAGYLQRANRIIYTPLLVGLTLVTAGASVWFTFMQPHAGLRTAILPLMTAVSAIWVVRILYHVPRPKSIIEWGGITAYGMFAVSETVVGVIALSQGAQTDQEVMNLYRSILFLTLPSFFILLGMFAMCLIASDLAVRAKSLADYQAAKRREEAEKSWGTVQDAIEAMPDLVAIDNGKGEVLTCNEAFAEFLGIDRDALVGRNTLEMFGLYSRLIASIDGRAITSAEDLAQHFWHALTTGARLNVHTWDDRNYLVDCGYLRAGGQILVARDVTQLHRTRRRLETAINSMPIGFALFDEDKQLVACNKSYERLLQQDEEWLSSQSLHSLIGALVRRLKSAEYQTLVERSEWLHEALDAIEKGALLNRVALLNDGSWIDLTLQPVEGEGFVSIANDITNRRLLELDLEKNEKQLREILGGQPFPVLVVRKSDNRVMFASTVAAEVLEIEEHKLLRRKADTFQPRAGDIYRRAGGRDRGESPLQEVQLSRFSGERFPALYSSQDIVFSGQDAQVISFIDISNIKDLQSELQAQREALFQSEKLNALGTLLAGVAHELNNPLTVVVANAHVLSLTSKDKKVQERLEKITDAADRCSRIVRSFLDMARKSPGETVTFDVVDCLQKALDLSMFGLQEDNVIVKADIAEELPAVKGDPDQFGQMILNLIINAKHALQKQEPPRLIEVVLCMNDDGSALELHVRDNGPGIPEAIRDRVFEPFFTTKKVGEGTGMGLSLVHGIVQSHGGTIELMPEAEGGAHFKITLPHTGAVLSKIPASPGAAVAGQRRHILIVDDEEDVLNALADILELQGHQVYAASTAGDALKAMDEHRFDGILSDFRMPDMDGQQLFGEIKARHPEMVRHVAFITGDDLSGQARSFLETCDRPYLGKPFLPKDVAHLLETLR